MMNHHSMKQGLMKIHMEELSAAEEKQKPPDLIFPFCYYAAIYVLSSFENQNVGMYSEGTCIYVLSTDWKLPEFSFFSFAKRENGNLNRAKLEIIKLHPFFRRELPPWKKVTWKDFDLYVTYICNAKGIISIMSSPYPLILEPLTDP